MKQKNIIQYYKKNIDKNSAKDKKSLLHQVGKTFLGKPINNLQLNLIIKSIKNNLDLNKNDIVLDLGCANGLITNKIANSVKLIHGIDLSPDLISIAQKNTNRDNEIYQSMDILNINFCKYKTTKIYMYEVLQHFNGEMLRKLLEKINKSYEKFTLYIASIPDNSKLFKFYNTDERKKFYFFEILEKNKFHLGAWWYKEHLILIAKELGLSAKIIKQDNRLHTSHYRFDILITKK